MLKHIDALVVDLQDVGARPYTYIWTIKYCIEACTAAGIPVYILDRPNPVGVLQFDGPVLEQRFYSFVGGAQIPLCHRLTVGEIVRLMHQTCFPSADITIIWMKGWWRRSLFSDTALPWVLPSPNMPTLDTALVYSGMVLLEGTNVSEGRGTTRPFELFGAPFLDTDEVVDAMKSYNLSGYVLREHGFIPTFQKWKGEYCRGMQLHVTDPVHFRPVAVAVALIATFYRLFHDTFRWKQPPYEYENTLLPFDILCGSDAVRNAIESDGSLDEIFACWHEQHRAFKKTFDTIAYYPENQP
jgi:uncharacterized protein YbbC (DUF1343 family)